MLKAIILDFDGTMIDSESLWHKAYDVWLKENHGHEFPLDLFIRNAGSRIITTHLSDYDFVDERHWVPGDGKINWREFYTLMEEAGYTGPYLFELGESISGQKLTPTELVARFKTVIGYED